MPTLRVTEKLAKALSTTSSIALAEPKEPQHEWFADLFYAEGKKCVIWVHRPTLLTFGSRGPLFPTPGSLCQRRAVMLSEALLLRAG